MSVLLSRTVIEPIIILIVTFFLCYISRIIVYRVFAIKKNNAHAKKKKTIANLISNIIIIFFTVIGFTMVLQTFGIDTASFVASLGVFSLVMGLALQDLLKDLFSGITIILEGQYNIGDWVEVGGFKGEVIASSLRTTRLKAYTGEIKIISNRQITELINYSLSPNIAIIDIGVSYNSDVDKVKKVVANLAKRLVKENKLKTMECLGMQVMENSSLVFRIISETEHPNKLPVQRLINEEIFKEFSKHDIEIPYQQVVVHNGKTI